MPITYAAKKENISLSVDDVGSKIEEMIRKSEELLKEIDTGESLSLLFSFKKKLILITMLSNQTDYISVIGDSSINEARLRMEVRKTIESVENIFKE